MMILEHEAKALLRSVGVAVPNGTLIKPGTRAACVRIPWRSKHKCAVAAAASLAASYEPAMPVAQSRSTQAVRNRLRWRKARSVAGRSVAADRGANFIVGHHRRRGRGLCSFLFARRRYRYRRRYRPRAMRSARRGNSVHMVRAVLEEVEKIFSCANALSFWHSVWSRQPRRATATPSKSIH